MIAVHHLIDAYVQGALALSTLQSHLIDVAWGMRDELPASAIALADLVNGKINDLAHGVLSELELKNFLRDLL